MSIPRTLRNKPRVNYAILNSGSNSISPSPEQLSLDLGSTPQVKDFASTDQQELEALEDEKVALAAELQRLQQLKSVQDKKKEVEELHEAVSKLQLEHSPTRLTAAHARQGVSKKDRKVPFKTVKTEPMVSLANLRQMESLTQEVDKKMKHFGLADSSDEGQSTSTVDSFSSDDERSKDAKARGKRRKKLKSGKTAKITTRIVNPQIWPHSDLSLTHVSKEVSYDDLTIEEFTAGYCSILKNSRISEEEKAARISHLYDLMYLAMHYEWLPFDDFTRPF